MLSGSGAVARGADKRGRASLQALHPHPQLATEEDHAACSVRQAVVVSAWRLALSRAGVFKDGIAASRGQPGTDALQHLLG
eukprot:jgi/Tetstr1/447629/TSEL_034989.t1